MFFFIWDGEVRQFININIYVRPGAHGNQMVGLFFFFESPKEPFGSSFI
uniref:Uncharacterized protein n=1 Tax=viral metagenome TaxID=1070528 RepID=A0A6C0AEW7_9ZZZZ